MTINDLESIESKIGTKIEEYGKKYNSNKDVIIDGIVSEKLFLSSKYKIMWVLKEPYGDGGYKLGTDLVSEKNRIKNKDIPAQKVMSYVTYCILNNKYFQEIDTSILNHNILEMLTHIAWVNINKIPGLKKSGNMANEYNYWKEILFTQLKSYEPEIIIFGGTFQHFKIDWKSYFAYEPILKNKRFTQYFSHDNLLGISAYHPTYPNYPEARVDIKNYVNEIIDVVREKIK